MKKSKEYTRRRFMAEMKRSFNREGKGRYGQWLGFYCKVCSDYAGYASVKDIDEFWEANRKAVMSPKASRCFSLKPKGNNLELQRMWLLLHYKEHHPLEYLCVTL